MVERECECEREHREATCRERVDSVWLCACVCERESKRAQKGHLKGGGGFCVRFLVCARARACAYVCWMRQGGKTVRVFACVCLAL